MEKIDDSDPRLVYEPIGDWHTTGSDNEYNDTIHFTGNAGASVTLVFNGTGVGVYGTIAVASNPGGAPITIFSLDDSVDRTEYSAIPPQSTDLYLQRWYFSPPLENGQHTLVASNYLNGASMYLDYFVVTSPTSAPSLQSSPQSTSPSSTTLGVIVGGVLGGVIIILTAVIIILLARSRRRKAESAEMGTTGRCKSVCST
ncbi:hypothetical protein F5887DRAFT_1131264 [Amanita rubescens]|nr:hypothetical protein F5887DRAFT_1131264 [Amanita rubescens]